MMPRYTDRADEVRHLAGLPDAVLDIAGRQGRVFLKDGTHLDGTIFNFQCGNNAGVGGRWQYFGSVVVQTEEEEIEVDYLDVTHMTPAQSPN